MLKCPYGLLVVAVVVVVDTTLLQKPIHLNLLQYTHFCLPRTSTMNAFIKNRVEPVFRHIGGTYEIVPNEIVRFLSDKLKDDLTLAPRKAQTKTMNGADLSPQEIRNFLGGLPIDQNLVAKLIWPSYQSGISLPFYLFVENYDELWYPASDDLWITDQNMNWVLEVDHEENFTFFQF